MLIRTHLAFIVLALILFVPHVDNNLIFIFVALIATMLPDIDSAGSTIGHHRVFDLFRFFVHHRGFIHSFTFCFLISVLFAIFWPVVALPFFLGYGLHLFVDSFTQDGISPFWPYKKRSSWKLHTGSLVETTLFLFLLLLDLFLFIIVFWKLF